MRVAIYARVSTGEQTTENQLQQLRPYIEARGWTVAEVYEDKGISGAKDSRPALNRMMDAAKKRQFDAVVVWKFDRFARSVSHLLRALGEFEALGIQFVSYTENLDTSTPMGRCMFTIVGAMAQLERDLIRERVKAGMSRARAEGKSIGGQKKVFRRDEALRMRAEGQSLRKIAAELGVNHQTIANALKTSESTSADAAD